MGHYSHSCQLSGLPITDNEKVYFQILINNVYYKYTENGYGKSNIISNDTTRLKFNPFALPIKGEYNGYGRLENIEEDENTKILEKYFGMPIKEITDIICSNRKDDGYDDILKKLKTNPEHEYGDNVKYKEEYKEILSLSATWFRKDVVDKLNNRKREYLEYQIGEPYIVEYLGFKHKQEDTYEKDGIELMCGTYIIETEKGTLYDISNLQQYLKNKRIDTNGKMDELMEMDSIDIFYNFGVKNMIDYENFTEEQKKKALAIIEKTYPTMYKVIKETDGDIIDIIKSIMLSGGNNEFDHFILKYQNYESPLYSKYVSVAKKGELKELVRSNRTISNYLYVTGRYYDYVGTSPQDGDFDEVQNLLKVSLELNINKYEDREAGDVDYNGYDNQFLKVSCKKGYLSVIEDHYEENDFDVELFRVLSDQSILYDQVEILEFLFRLVSTEGHVSNSFRIAVENNAKKCIDFIMSHNKFINEHITDRLVIAHKNEEVLIRLLNHPEFDLDKIDFEGYYLKHNEVTKVSLSGIIADIRDQKIDEILS